VGKWPLLPPRSFANRAHFRAFRHFFLDRVEFDHIHVYDSRSVAFSDDAVLQENVILSLDIRDKGERQPERQVIVSPSDRPSGRATVREVPHEQVVNIKDPERSSTSRLIRRPMRWQLRSRRCRANLQILACRFPLAGSSTFALAPPSGPIQPPIPSR
jgi:hypothetical protein